MSGAPAHLSAAAAGLLAAVLQEGAPADLALRRHFKAHGRLGARDRAWIREAVYGCLRHRRTLAAALNDPEPAPPDLVAAWAEGRHQALDPASLPPAVRAELPDWLFEALAQALGETEALALAAALNQTAPLDLRVNTLKAKRERVAARLEGEGLPVAPTPHSPAGLRHTGRPQLGYSKAFQEGLMEVQDEGSQILAPLLDPRRGETVVDLCAGAGGKTLHLGALMGDKGLLYAFEVDERRLGRMAPRLKRAGLTCVRAVHVPDVTAPAVQRLAGKVDRVLVDAPCSGTGTLRRDPEVRWRPLDLPTFTATQDRLLDAAAALLRPGGRLVYATCSLLREENEDRIAAFLTRHADVHPIPIAPILARRKVSLAVADEATALRLYPHRHGTDGFFAAVLERRSGG